MLSRSRGVFSFILIGLIFARVIYSTQRFIAWSEVLWEDASPPPAPPTRANQPKEKRCAFVFYGLPRSFSAIVLPTIIKHVLEPNANYSCDVFAQYHDLTNEPASRSGYGGQVDPRAILQLTEAVKDVFGNQSSVEFTSTTEAAMQEQYSDLFEKIRTANNTDGTWRYRYWRHRYDIFPLETHFNIVRMWHNQMQAYELMENVGRQRHVDYHRVAMLRNDVAFLSPIDIWTDGNEGKDINNSVAVIPKFASHPVNDRLYLGPAPAVKIWATKHFEYLEPYLDRIANIQRLRRYGIHSERYLAEELLPRIGQLGYPTIKSEQILFARVRADGSILNKDCGRSNLAFKDELEETLGRPCYLVRDENVTQDPIFLVCPLTNESIPGNLFVPTAKSSKTFPHGQHGYTQGAQPANRLQKQTANS